MLLVFSRGSDEPLRAALTRVLGGGELRLRDLVHVSVDLWQATVRDLWVPQGETQRDLTALEVGVSQMVLPARCWSSIAITLDKLSSEDG